MAADESLLIRDQRLPRQNVAHCAGVDSALTHGNIHVVITVV